MSTFFFEVQMKKHPLLKKWKRSQYAAMFKLLPFGYGRGGKKVEDVTKLDADQVKLVGMFPPKRTGADKRPITLCKVSELSVETYDIEMLKLWEAKKSELVEPTVAVAVDKTTLNDLIARYVDPENGYLKTCKDQVNMKHHLDFWRKRLGTELVCWNDAKGKSMWPRKIAECRDYILKDRSGSTANNYMATLGSVFSFCSTEDVAMCEGNPVTKVTKSKVNNERVRKLDEEELAALLMECQKSTELSKLGATLGSADLYDMVMFSILTASRFSECRKLAWEHVSFEDNDMVFIERKNGEDHHFSIEDPELQELLQRRFQNADSAMVFPKPEVRGAFERACKRAGIEDFRWHDLRHTSISYVLMSGGTLKEAQQHAGHKSYQSTLRYGHLDTTTTKKTSGMISKRIKGVS
jgi:integrase